MTLKTNCTMVLGIIFCGSVGQALAEAPPKGRSDLFEASVEELKQTKITVSSVSKRDQDLFEAASAVYVITAEDIRRSGLTSLPELLRLAPGMDVAQVTSQRWMVSARGFNQQYADKLLVLVDGRIVYTPAFGGVYWEVQDYPLEDIARIEVIRGPGATLWGANAVNGVVNIISKKSQETQGTLLTAIGGTYDRAMGLMRHGGKLGEKAHYRVYAKYFQRDDLVDEHGKGRGDGWNIKSGGFQADGKFKNDSWMLQGRKYRGGGKILNKIATLPARSIVSEKNAFSGQHVLANWAHSMASGSDLEVKVFHDQTWRNERPLYRENRYIWDVEAQHHYTGFSRQDIVWGAGYRVTSGRIGLDQYVVAVDPDKRIERTYNFFVQDEIALRQDFHLTVGSKFEKNMFTGSEIQPSARFSWSPNPKHNVWGAVSRAVRIPTRSLADVTTHEDSFDAGEIFGEAPLALPLRINFLPNKKLVSEQLLAFELGYRARPTSAVFLDFAAFYNKYRGLLDPMALEGDIDYLLDPVLHVMYPVQYTNAIKAKSVGLEWLANWQVCPTWVLKAGYTYLHIQAKTKNPDNTLFVPYWEASGPRNQFQLHSDWKLPHQIGVGVGMYYVDPLKAVPSLLERTPSYVRADLRLSWEPVQKFLVELVGQHLLKARYPQAHSADTYREGKIERGVYLKVKWGV